METEINCAYCDKELKGENILYDKNNNLAFCVDEETIVNTRWNKKYVKAIDFDLNSLMPGNAMTSILSFGCAGKYIQQHKKMMICPNLIPLSKLEEEIELNNIRKGKN